VRQKIKNIMPRIWLVASILFCLGGLAAFIFLFVLDFNMYWLILSPIILAVYESPAAFFFWLYKKTRSAEAPKKNNAPDGI
jgi:Ca2+/Na+ antiporter